MAKRKTVEQMQKQQAKLRERLEEACLSSKANANKLDKLANRIEVLNCEIAAALYKRKTIEELKNGKQTGHQAAAYR